MPSSVLVKTPVFEGPLDLLLELIESRKLLINDISLAGVCDEYIARINQMGELPLGEASDFVALAATLLLIKSRSLLPNLELSDEETRDIKELEYRLAVYQIVKEASGTLRAVLQDSPLWEGYGQEPEPLFVPDERATPTALKGAILRLIEEYPQALSLPKVAVKKAVSLEETIEKMAHRISAAMRLSFHEFSGHGKKEAARYDIVVSFLALLELVKQGIIRATQESDYGDIMLEKDGVSTPSYE